MGLIAAKAALQSFLWSEGLIPLELDSLTVPEEIDAVVTTNSTYLTFGDTDALLAAHPALTLTESQLAQLAVERRWKAEMLKPIVDVKYNALTTRPNDNLEFGAFNENERVFGVDVEFPLFLRKERGGLKMADLKIQDKRFDLENKRLNLRLKFERDRDSWDILEQQYLNISSNADDAQQLLQSERQLFNFGESSLFLVNSRELSYISALTKAISSLAKNRMAEMKTRHSLGIMR